MQSWRNFDIELFGHDTVGDVESVQARVARSPAGEQREPVTVPVSAALRAKVKALEQDTLSLAQTVDLGKALAQVLLFGELGVLFDRSRDLLAEGEGLRVRIVLRSLALADLPWEYVYRARPSVDDAAPERGFLALDRSLSLVRYEPVSERAASCEPLGDQPLRVAVLLANPAIPGWGELNLDGEADAIRRALADEPGVQTDVRKGADERAFNDAMDAGPHVFHFAGHGRFRLQPSDQFGVYVGEGELLFEDGQGKAHAMSAREIALRMRGTGVRLAVLNNCESARRDQLNAWTGIAPTLVRDGVPAVVAMQYSVRDAHAERFARRLYRNLARHESIDSAVTAARLAMFNLDEGFDREWGIPVLYLRSDQSVLFPTREQRRSTDLAGLGRHGILNLALSVALVFVLSVYFLLHIQPRLPLGSLVGGVLLAALLAAGAYVKLIAGDALRSTLLGWVRRRVATGALIGALAAVGLAYAVTPRPMAIHVLPGKSLMSQVAPADLENPARVYQLRVAGDDTGALHEDFRKNGVVLASSRSLAARLGTRYADRSAAGVEAYLAQVPEPFQERFRDLWLRPAAAPLGFDGVTGARTITLSLEQNGRVVSCRPVERGDLADDLSVIFLESSNECP